MAVLSCRGFTCVIIFIFTMHNYHLSDMKLIKPLHGGRSRNLVGVHRMRQRTWNNIFQTTSTNETTKEVPCDTFPNNVPNDIQSYESIGCKPRKTIVPINSPLTRHQFAYLHPTHVEVHRCLGMCESNPYVTKTCMSVEAKIIEIPVTAIVMKSPTETSAQCFLVSMEEHVKCDCDCSIKEKQCHPSKEIYNKSQCRCDCKNASQSSKCSDDKIWDPVTCGCECAHESACSTGYLFHPEYCTCVKIAMKNKKKPAKATKFERKVFKRS